MTTRTPGTLARFATEHGRLTDIVVKPKLFEPNRELKLSVFQVSGLGQTEIQGIGEEVVREHQQAERLYGWGEVNEGDVVATGLQIDYDDVPPRHANITDWPQDSAQRKLTQQMLASQSTPIRLNPPIEVC